MQLAGPRTDPTRVYSGSASSDRARASSWSARESATSPIVPDIGSRLAPLPRLLLARSGRLAGRPLPDLARGHGPGRRHATATVAGLRLGEVGEVERGGGVLGQDQVELAAINVDV